MNSDSHTNNSNEKNEPHVEASWLSMSEASKLVPYSAEYLSLLARKGKIASKKIGNVWYTTKPILGDYMKKQMIRAQVQNGNLDAVKPILDSDTPEHPLNPVRTFYGDLKEMGVDVAPPVRKSSQNFNDEKREPLFTTLKNIWDKEEELEPTVFLPARDASPYKEDRHKTSTQHEVNESNSPFSELGKSLPAWLATMRNKTELSLTESKKVAEIEEVLERVFDKKLPNGSQQVRTPRQSVVTNFKYTLTSRTLVAVMIVSILSLTLLPVPIVFSFFEKSLTAFREAVNDSNTVMGLRPGTHANEILLLDKEGNVSIMGHIETEGQLRSFVADGVAPIVVDSVTMVENLNAEMVGGVAVNEFTLAFITANGNVTTEDVVFEGSVEVGKTLKVRGATQLQSALSVGGDLTVFGKAQFKQAFEVLGPAHFKELVTLQKDLSVKGDIETNGNLDVKKNISVRGSIEAGSSIIGKSGTFKSLSSSGSFSAGGKITLGNAKETITITTENFTLNAAGDATFDGSVTIDGALTVGGAIISDGAITVGEGNFTDLTVTNSTTTNATTTKAYITHLVSDNATSTNLFSENAVFTNLEADSISFTDLVFTNATGTNSTTTNAFIASLTASIASIDDLTAGNLLFTSATGTSATTTNFFTEKLRATLATITSIIADDASVGALTATNSTSTNATTTNAFITSLTADSLQFTNATGTSATTTNLFSTTASSTNLFSTSANLGFVVLGNATSTNLFSTTASSTNLFSTNFNLGVGSIGSLTAGDLSVTDSTNLNTLTATGDTSLQNLTFTNATGTQATTTNFFSTTGTFTNLFGTNSTLENSTITDLIFTRATGTSATTTNLFSTNANFTNLTSTNVISENHTITNLIFENATGTNATTTNLFSTTASSTNLFSTNANLGFVVMGNATSTNLFSTTASSTNLFSSLLTVGGDALVVDSNRRVGIGTTNPGKKLEVKGSSTSDVTNTIQVVSSTGNILAEMGSAGSSLSSERGFFALRDNGTRTIQLAANSSDGTTYFNAGNVGIGTTTPVQKLDVNGNIRVNNKIYANADDTTYLQLASNEFRIVAGNSVLGTFGNGNIVRLGASNAFNILANGNVGIGDITPTQLLTIKEQTGASAVIEFQDTDDARHGTIGVARQANDILTGTANLDFVINNRWGANMIFGTSDSERMRITSAGNVGIGTTAPPASLTVVKDLNATGGDATGFRLQTAADQTGQVLFGGASSAGDFTFWQSYKEGTSSGGRPLALNPIGGNVGIGTTDPGSFKLNVNGNTNITGNLLVTGNSTTTNATTTNFFSTTGRFTNLFSDTFNVTDLIFERATGTSATTTNFFSTTASSTNLFSSLLTVGGDALVVDSNRRVGIGTTNPTSSLDISPVTGNGVVTLGRAGVGNAIINAPHSFYISFDSDNNNSGEVFDIAANRDGTGGTSLFRILETGNVGIGTTSPGAPLEVAASSEEDYKAPIRTTFNRGARTGISLLNTSALYSNPFTSSNLGILSGDPINSDFIGMLTGWNADSGGMQVLGTSNALGVPGLALQGSQGVEGTTRAAIYLNAHKSNGAGGTAAITGSNKVFSVANRETEVFSIVGSGNVGIGELAPGSKLSVSGGGSFGAGYDTTAAPTNGLIVEGSVGIGTSSLESWQKFRVKSSSTNGSVFGTDTGAVMIGYSDGSTDGNQIQGRTGASLATNGNLIINPFGGNVGIGTTTPQDKLSVAGNIRVGEYGTSASISFPNTVSGFASKIATTYGSNSLTITGASNVIDLNQNRIKVGTTAFVETNNGSHYVSLGTNSSEAMRIINGGNVGIGTTSPSVKFSVGGLAGDTSGHGYFTGGLGIGLVNTEAGTLKTTGDAEIGGALTITGSAVSSATTGQFTFLAIPSGTAIGQGTVYINPASAGTNNVLLGVAVNGTEKLRIDAEGDVQITGLFNSTNTAGTNSFSGGLEVLGNTVLGTNASNTLAVNARISSNIIPSADDTYDLGTSALRWANFYSTNAVFDTISTASSTEATFIINSDNATADTEDASLQFERGTSEPNAIIKWDSTNKRFDFNDFPVRLQNKLVVSGTASSSIAGPLWLTGTPQGTSLADASLYLNPSSASANNMLFGIGVAGVQRFSVDAEGDVLSHASLGIENALFDITEDTLTIDDKLQINGNEIKDSTGTARITIGSTINLLGLLDVTGSGIDFSAPSAILNFSSATGVKQIQTGGTTDLALMPGGSVGIGNTSPRGKLDVTGNIIQSGGSQFQITGSLSSTGFQIVGADGGTNILGTMGANEPLAIRTGATERMRVTADGDVGVGTINPLAKFVVDESKSGTATGDGVVSILQGAGALNARTELGFSYSGASSVTHMPALIGYQATTYTGGTSGSFYIATRDGTTDVAPTQRLTILPGGNVGIGVTAPVDTLQVNGGLTLGSDAVIGDRTRLYESNGLHIDSGVSSRPIIFEIDSSEKVRIDTSGNVGIGTTTPDVWNAGGGGAKYLSIVAGSTGQHARIDIAGVGTGQGVIAFGNQTIRRALIADVDGSHLTFYTNTTNTGTGVSEKMRITSSGNVGIGTNDPQAKLDVRGPTSLFGTAIGDTYISGNSINGQYSVNANGIFYINYTGYQAGTTQFRDTQISDGKAGNIAFFDGSTGNVGIGTASPGSALDVNGEIRTAWGPSSDHDRFTIYNSDSYNMGLRRGSRDLKIFAKSPDGDGHIYLQPNNTTAMTLLGDGSGNVGIGLTNPLALLTLNKATTTTAVGDAVIARLQGANAVNSRTELGLTYAGASGYYTPVVLGYQATSFTGSTAGSFYIATREATTDTAPTQRFTILPSGNVGIGTTTPGYKLGVAGTLGVTGTSMFSNHVTVYDGGAGQGQITLGHSEPYKFTLGRRPSDGLFEFSGNQSGSVGYVFQGISSELLRISPSGNVGIGTTTPWGKLAVYGGSATVPVINAKSTLNTGNAVSLLYLSSLNIDGVTTINDQGNIVSRGSLNVNYTGSNTGNTLISSASSYANLSMYNNAGIVTNYLNTNGNSYINGGNVGIGTASPSEKLHVSGNLLVTGNSTTTNATTTALFSTTAKFTNLYADTVDFTDLVFNNATGTNATTTNLYFSNNLTGPGSFIVNSSGNVGIGTSPSTKLHVLDGASSMTFKTNADHTIQTLSTTNGLRNSFTQYQVGSTKWQIGHHQSGNKFSIQRAASADMESGVLGSDFVIDSSGNVGIGTTTPLVKLHISGSNAYVRADGSSNSGLEIYESGSRRWLIDNVVSDDRLRFYSNTAGEAISVLQSGNVGIGTASPDALLHVEKASAEIARLTASTATAAGYLVLEQGTTVRGYLGFQDSSGGSLVTSGIANATVLRGNAGLHLTGGSAATTGITINTSGNVGIGTTTPSDRLNIKNNNSGLQGLRVTSESFNDRYVTFGYDSTSDSGVIDARPFSSISDRGLDLRTQGSTVMRLTNGGNVGIGTTTPRGKLDVIGNIIQSGGSQFQITNSLSSTGFQIIGADGGTNILGTMGANEPLAIRTGAVERVRIDTSGNVGIGTSTPQSKLHIEGNTGFRVNNASTDGFNFLQINTNTWSFRGLLGADNLVLENGTGNVGIGVTDPNQKLHVDGSILAGAIAQLMFGDGDYGIGKGSGAGIRVWTEASTDIRLGHGNLASTPRLTIASGGNIGIGTTTPNAGLHINTGSSITDTQVRIVRDESHNDADQANLFLEAGQSILSARLNFGTGADAGASIRSLQAAAGSAASTELSFWTRGAAGDVSQRMVIDKDGNVGIGTTTPSAPLTVQADSNGNAVRLIGRASDGIAELAFRNNAGTAYQGWIQGRSTGLAFSGATSQHMTLDTSGNVGIGTTTPGAKLDVMASSGYIQRLVSGANGADYINFYNGATSASVGSINRVSSNALGISADSHLTLTTNGSERIRIDSSGNVGIGTATNLNEKLNVLGDVAIRNSGAAATLQFEASDASVRGDLVHTFGGSGNSGSLAISVDNASSVKTEVMRLLGSGNVGIGTTTPVNRLQVHGSTADIRITNNTMGSSVTDGLRVGVANNSNTAEIWNYEAGPLRFATNNTEYLTILSGGNVGIGTTDPGLFKLNVAGDLRFTGDLYNAATGNFTARSNRGFIFQMRDDGFTNDDNFNVTDDGTSRFIVKATGNVGIGTTSPQKVLHTVGGGVRIDRGGGGSYWDIGPDETNDFKFVPNGGTEAMRITNTGNVGIGTTSPSQLLTLSTVYPVLKFEEDGVTADNKIWYLEANSEVFKGRILSDSESAGSDWLQVDRTGSTVDYVSFPNGNVGIGTTAPNQKLEVAGIGRFTGIGTFSVGGDTGQYRIDTSGGGTAQAFRFLNSSNSFEGIRVRSASIGNTYADTANAPTNGLLVEGNVGIGTTSPSTKLTIQGGADATNAVKVFSSTGNELGVLGSAGSSASAERGFLALSDNGTRKVVIAANGSDSATYFNTGGNVGIGTTSPSTKLHVSSGDLLIERQSGVPSIYVGTGPGTAGTKTLRLQYSITSNKSLITSHEDVSGGQYRPLDVIAQQIDLKTGSGSATSRITILEGGNVGIGTTNPASKLSVHGNTRINTTTVDGDENRFLFAPGGSSDPATQTMYKADATTVGISLSADGTSYFNSGNVGIGTITPGAKLVVDNATTSTAVGHGIVTRLQGAGAANSRTEMGLTYSGASGLYAPVLIGYQATSYTGFTSGAFYIATRDATTDIAPTQRLTILPNGNVGIGDTTPDQVLHVVGTTPIRFERSGVGYAELGIDNITGAADAVIYPGTNGSGVVLKYMSAAGASLTGMVLDESGNVGIGTTDPDVYGFGASRRILTVSDTATAHIQIAAGGTSSAVLDLGNATIRRAAITGIDGSNLLFYTNTSNSGTTVTEKMRITSAGNVGIGTTAPQHPLQVYGTLKVGGSSGQAAGIIALGDDLSTANNVGMYRGTIAGVVGGGNVLNLAGYSGVNITTGNVAFGSQSVALTALTSGNIGIGTTTPSGILTVSGATGQFIVNAASTGGAASALLQDQSTNLGGLVAYQSGHATLASQVWLKNYNASGPIVLGAGGGNTAHVYVKSDGKVGVGLTSPIAKFAVEHATTTTAVGDAVVARLQGANAANSRTELGLTYAGASGYYSPVVLGYQATSFTGSTAGSFYIATREATTDTAPTERLTILPSGNVGIGVTSSSARLTVRGAGLTSQDFFHIEDSGGVRMMEVISDASGNAILDVKDTSGANKIRFNSVGDSYLTGGNVGIGTTSPSYKLAVERSGGPGTIHVKGNSTGYTHADIRLEVSNSDTPSSRGAGIYTFNPGNSANWYFGNAYSTSDRFVINRKGSTTSFDNSSADTSNSLFTILSGGNVGIGTADPGSILTVSVAGTTITSDMTNAVSGLNMTNAGSGNAFAQIHHESAGNNSGVLRLTDDITTGSIGVQIHGNGTSYFENGSVGIGTTSPSSRLDVWGSNDTAGQVPLRVTGGHTISSKTAIRLDNTHASSRNWSVNNEAGEFRLYQSSAALGDPAAGNQRFTININGNVGIGTTTPAEKLVLANPSGSNTRLLINADGGASPSVQLTGGGTNMYSIYNYAGGGDLRFATGAGFTDRVTFTSAGNVGIGTTSPQAKLHVASGFSGTTPYTGGGTPALVIEQSGGVNTTQFLTSDNGVSRIWFGDGGGGTTDGLIEYDHNLTASANDILTFRVGGTDTMFLKGGNVGIGSTNPSASKLQIVASGSGITHQKTVGGYFTSLGFNLNEAYLTHYTENRFIIGYGSATGGAPTVETLTLTNTGNVGVGDTTPTEGKLVVGGSVAITAGDLLLRQGGNNRITVSDGTARPLLINASLTTFETGPVTVASNLTAKNGIETGWSGGDSNINSGLDYKFGYQEDGAWVSPYPDLVLAYHTGVKIGGYYGYDGTRFYNDHPGRAGATEIFSVGKGDQNVRVVNNLYVGGLTATRAVCTTTSGLLTVSCTSAGLAASLSDETGTGSAVFSASPTFTGTASFSNTIHDGGADYRAETRWMVSSGDTAHQRADARDDATNYSRLHWYGASDAGATSNFRHAWYDGSSYINVTAQSGGVTFGGNLTANQMYASDWFRNTVAGTGLYNEATGVEWKSPSAEYMEARINAVNGGIRIKEKSTDAIKGYLYYNSNGFGLLHSGGGWALRIAPGGGSGTLEGNWSSGTLTRDAHAAGYMVGSYNSVGSNDTNTNPIYTIGSAYKPTDTLLSNMYGVGFSHSNFWGAGKSTGWGLYTAANGTIHNTISDSGIWTAGTISRAGNTVWDAGNDGAGSGLDADVLDGLTSASFLRAGTQSPGGNAELAASDNNSTSYSVAALELRESGYGGSSAYLAPRLGFHWGGVVASQIAIESDGKIVIRDNPGTGYEKFGASSYYVGATQIVDTSRNLVNMGTGAFSGKVGVLGGVSATYSLNVGGTTHSFSGYYYSDNLGVGSTSVCRSTTLEYQIGHCTSLLEYKENITNLSLGMDEIMQLRPVEYNWKDPKMGGHELGFIAEEVQAVSPMMAEYNADGTLSGVRYAHISSLLVKGVQELNMQTLKISDLEALTSASTTPTSGTAGKFAAAMKNTMKNLGVAIENGVTTVGDLAAGTITSKTVITNELCVGATCVTEEQFAKMVDGSGLADTLAFAGITLYEKTAHFVALTVDKMNATLAYLEKAFIRDLYVENKLCVDDVCVDKEQLKQMLINGGGGVYAETSTSTSPTTTSSTTSEPTATTTEPTTTTEPASSTTPTTTESTASTTPSTSGSTASTTPTTTESTATTTDTTTTDSSTSSEPTTTSTATTEPAPTDTSTTDTTTTTTEPAPSDTTTTDSTSTTTDTTTI